MITKLRVKNFKSHKDTDLTLKNLTVLTGVNGCGKTSFVQSLLLLRQSYLKGRLSDGLDLNKPLCSIGIGNDALYRRATEGELLFRLVMGVEQEEYLFSYSVDERSLNDSFLKKKNYSDNIVPEKLNKLSLFNNDFQYVSASRWGGVSIFPKETYAAETQRQISLEYGQGELVAQFLNVFGGNEVIDYTSGEEQDLSLLSQTVYWEQKISRNITIHVESGKDNSSYTISYGYNAGDAAKPIQDLKAENMGYGISYSLPVIVALLSAAPGAMVIIENPEAHLHPSGQAQLARLITMVAARGVQVIVETHSDHIITAIQLACQANLADALQGISHQDVAVYYFSQDAQNTLKYETVEIQSDGILKHQPKGFFDQAEIDYWKLMYHA